MTASHSTHGAVRHDHGQGPDAAAQPVLKGNRQERRKLLAGQAWCKEGRLQLLLTRREPAPNLGGEGGGLYVGASSVGYRTRGAPCSTHSRHQRTVSP